MWLTALLLFILGNTGLFLDASGESGLRFTHDNGMCGEYYLPEITGQGAALFDYDNDGDLDVYLVQGGSFAGMGGCGDANPTDSDQLFRNDTTRGPTGAPAIRFSNVTSAAGLHKRGYGMGVSTGDYDNDGDVDLYVTNLGPNQLLRNNGDGTFSDVTENSGVDDQRWSTSSTFFDYDRDGYLDLFLTNYVDFTVAGNRTCYAASSARDYCGPDAYKPVPDRLFRNRRDGTFEDVTARAGILSEFGAGLGVISADFNNDGWLDLYVANDGDPNLLWINQKKGTFRNEALLAGVALDQHGVPEAGMGVDVADFDEDGDEDIFVTNIMKETNTFYLNLGSGLFEDRTNEVGLALPSARNTAFGTGWFDFDNDGWLDLIVLNGAVTIIEELARKGDPYPLHLPNQLFRNQGNGTLAEVTDLAGEVFKLSEVSRGAALGDVDNDGDADVLITNSHGPARLLVNTQGNRNNWIGLRLVNARFKRDMVGARVEILTGSGTKRFRRVKADGSYCSASDPRILAGLGAADHVTSIRVIWPDGQVEEWAGLTVNQYHVIVQGTGRKAP